MTNERWNPIGDGDIALPKKLHPKWVYQTRYCDMRDRFYDPLVRSLTQEIPPHWREVIDEAEAKIKAMDAEEEKRARTSGE